MKSPKFLKVNSKRSKSAREVKSFQQECGGSPDGDKKQTDFWSSRAASTQQEVFNVSFTYAE